MPSPGAPERGGVPDSTGRLDLTTAEGRNRIGWDCDEYGAAAVKRTVSVAFIVKTTTCSATTAPA